MNDPFFNWTVERHRLARFLEAKPGVLHIIATHGCNDSGFMQVVEESASKHDPPFTTCVLDSQNMATSTPLEILRTLLRSLNLHDEYMKKVVNASIPTQQVNHILSDNRARRDINIENVEVKISTVTKSENEEVLSIVSFLIKRVHMGYRFDHLIVIFTQCHETSEIMRKKFWSSLWEPALKHLLSSGARFVFHYQEPELKFVDRAIPPRPTTTIELPKRLDAAVVAQIAEYAVINGWEQRGQPAEVFARTIYDLSLNAAELSGHIGTIKLQRSEV